MLNTQNEKCHVQRLKHEQGDVNEQKHEQISYLNLSAEFPTLLCYNLQPETTLSRFQLRLPPQTLLLLQRPARAHT